MVDPVLSVTYALNAVAMIALPIVVGIVIVRRLKTRWSLLGWGALTFIASQGVRLPLLFGLTALLQGREVMSPEAATVFNIVFLSLTAGLFEEGARWLGYRFIIRDARRWEDAVTYGAGHGGIEAIIFGVLAGLTLVNMVVLRGLDLTTLPMTAEQLELTRVGLEAFWSAPWYLTILGAVERVFALTLHITLSAMVLQCFTRNNRWWLVAAMLWHALANIVGVGVAQAAGPLAAEGALAVVALVSLGLLFWLRRPTVTVNAEVAA